MPRSLWNVLLIAIVSLSMLRLARAESLNTLGTQVHIGIGVVATAVAFGAALIVLHEKHKTSPLTGCVTSAAGGLSLTDDSNKKVYALSGTTTGIKPGDRVTLTGKRHGKVFEASSVVQDLGVCQP